MTDETTDEPRGSEQDPAASPADDPEGETGDAAELDLSDVGAEVTADADAADAGGSPADEDTAEVTGETVSDAPPATESVPPASEPPSSDPPESGFAEAEPSESGRTDAPGDGIDRVEPRESTRDAGTTGSVAGGGRTADERKWFLAGVGGAGNNLVDAVLLRKRTLEERGDPLAMTWQSGLQGITSINTNRNELRETYFAAEESDRPESTVAIEHQLGEGGAGYNEADADEDVRRAFEAGNPFTDIPTFQKKEIQRAQATMLLHSAVKGTGSGATPRIAKHIEEDPLAEYDRADRPLYSSVVLPTEGRDYASFSKGVKVKNAAVCLARTSSHVDALIPFDNQRLEQSRTNVEIEGADDWYTGYASANEALVAFLEAFSMSSIPTTQAQTKEIINGDVFDVRDPFRPVADRNPLNFDPDEKPATVLAPAHGWIRSREFDEQSLQKLLHVTLSQGKLAEFDEKTAWGGVFLFYGPEDLMSQVREVTRRSFLQAIGSPEILDLRNADIDVDVGNTHYVVAPSTEKVHLWTVLWNPEMKPIDDFCEYAMEEVEQGTKRGERIARFETELRNLRNQLGHEPFLS